MVQVVTNENIQQLIQTRQVPEFKAPEAKAEPAKPSEAAAATPQADSAPAQAQPAKAEQPRAEDGKFVKADDGKQAAKPEVEPAAQAADDEDDPALTEKIRKLINKKHRAMKEAEEFGRDESRRAFAAEARAEALQKQIDELKGTKSGNGPAPADSSDEPKQDDFKTVGEYAKALAKYEAAQARKADRAEQAKNTQEQQIQAVQQQFAERVASTAKQIPDYHEVVEAADWEVPHHIQAYIVDSEHGARLGYELAKNREEFDRIAKLSPIRAFAELGKLEDKLTARAAPPAKEPAPAAPTQVSRAPAPISPLEGKTTPVTKDPSQMSLQELRALRGEQRAQGKWRV